MRNKVIPYGIPVFFEGQYKKDKDYPLFIQQLICEFKVKENKIPVIMKKGQGLYSGNYYLTESGEDPVCLTLTNIDLKLFFENYDVENITYLSGWKFKGMQGIFNKYVDSWTEIKNFATKTNQKALRQTAKLMLNSLYRETCNKSRRTKQNFIC